MKEENQSWYVSHANLTYGPIVFDELVKGVESGQYLWVDLAIALDVESPKWRVINEIEAIRAALGRATDSSKDSSQWVVRSKENGVIDGPFALNDVLNLISVGKILYSDFAWRPDMADWIRVGDVSELDRSSIRRDVDMKSPRQAKLSPPACTAQADIGTSEELLKSVFLSGTLSPRPVLPSEFFQPLERQARRNVQSEDLLEAPSWIKILGMIGILILSATVKAASVLEIVPLKLNTDHPTVVFQTDAGLSEVISVKVRAKSGEILSFASYDLHRQIQRKEGEVPSLDIGALRLPAGTYTIDAAIGSSLKSSRAIFVGTKDAKFSEELKAHVKQLAAQQQAEKKALYYTSRQLENLSQSLAAKFDSTRLTPRLWTEFFADWRQKVEVALRPIRTVSALRPLAYPEEVTTLLTIVEKLKFEAKNLDQNVTQKRDPASKESAQNTSQINSLNSSPVGSTDNSQIALEFRALKARAAKLSSQP